MPDRGRSRNVTHQGPGSRIHWAKQKNPKKQIPDFILQIQEIFGSKVLHTHIV